MAKKALKKRKIVDKPPVEADNSPIDTAMPGETYDEYCARMDREDDPEQGEQRHSNWSELEDMDVHMGRN